MDEIEHERTPHVIARVTGEPCAVTRTSCQDWRVPSAPLFRPAMRDGFNIGDEVPMACNDQRRLALARFVEAAEESIEDAAGNSGSAHRTGRLLGI